MSDQSVKTPDQLAPEDAPASDHEAWVRRKITAALKKREDGEATYKSLDDIAAKYDADAR